MLAAAPPHSFASECVGEVVENCYGSVEEHFALPEAPGVVVHFFDVLGGVVWVFDDGAACGVKVFPAFLGEPVVFDGLLLESCAGVGCGDGELESVGV